MESDIICFVGPIAIMFSYIPGVGNNPSIIVVEECDMDLDGGLNHEEFEEFMKRLTADTFVYVTQGLIITLAIAPTVAIATKRSTEGVPGIGKVVQKLPNSVYAGLITFAVMMIQKANE